MDFTRQPIIETIVSAREGCKLVVRSSKSAGQEEYFVDAVEVVSFGNALFFRSMEKPKPFLVPATDYEVLEVREARMVLKNVAMSRTIKIAGGKEMEPRPSAKEAAAEKVEEEEAPRRASASSSAGNAVPDGRLERRKRRQYKRRRGRAEEGEEEATQAPTKEARIILPPPEFKERPRAASEAEEKEESFAPLRGAEMRSLLTPPPQLIRETIARYKEDDLFRNAFFEKGGEEDLVQRQFEEHEKVTELLNEEEEEMASGRHEEDSTPAVPLEQPAYGSFPQSEEEEEETYQIRKRLQKFEDREEEESDDPVFSPPFTDEENDLAGDEENDSFNR